MALTEIDRELLHRCLRGSAAGWRDFVNRFLGLFVQVIQHACELQGRECGSEELNDHCCEILLTLAKEDFAVLRSFRGESSLATYLCVVARRIVVPRLSTERGRDPGARLTGQRSFSRQEPQRLDDDDLVQQMVNGLAEPQASIIRQFHLEGKSYRQISDGLGIPESSIGPTLARARDRLRGGGDSDTDERQRRG